MKNTSEVFFTKRIENYAKMNEDIALYIINHMDRHEECRKGGRVKTDGL